MNILKLLGAVTLVGLLAGCATLQGEITLEHTPVGEVLKVAQTAMSPAMTCLVTSPTTADCVGGSGLVGETINGAFQATGMIVAGVVTPVTNVTSVAQATVLTKTIVKN